MGLIRSKRSNIMAEPRAVCMTLRAAFAERTKNSHNCAFFQRFNACQKWRRAPAGALTSLKRQCRWSTEVAECPMGAPTASKKCD